MSRTRLHASLRRGTAPSCEPGTGEVRVPLQLFALDEPAGDADLVMSRAEAATLFVHLRVSLGIPQQPERLSEAAR